MKKGVWHVNVRNGSSYDVMFMFVMLGCLSCMRLEFSCVCRVLTFFRSSEHICDVIERAGGKHCEEEVRGGGSLGTGKMEVLGKDYGGERVKTRRRRSGFRRARARVWKQLRRWMCGEAAQGLGRFLRRFSIRFKLRGAGEDEARCWRYWCEKEWHWCATCIRGDASCGLDVFTISLWNL